jgi:Zn-dependent protease
MPRPLAIVLFVLGAALSALWFSSSDPVLGLALLFVIFVHELGHALAMRLLGYGDTRIYFIPGFGGAAVGQKRDASIHVEGVVLLAGPLPGLFVGLVLALMLTQLPSGAQWELVREPLFAIALAAILVNYANLLPAMPLDGGRLAQRITSGIHPFIDVAFRVFSIALLGLGAITMGDFLIGMLAVVLALQTPATYRAAVLESALRARGASEWSEKQRLVEIYRGATVRGAVARRALATQVALRLAAPPADVWARAVWALVYLAVLVAPVILGFTALVAFAVAARL